MCPPLRNHLRRSLTAPLPTLPWSPLSPFPFSQVAGNGNPNAIVDPCDAVCTNPMCDHPDNFFNADCAPCVTCHGGHLIKKDANNGPHTVAVMQMKDTNVFAFKCDPGWEGEDCYDDTDDCKHHNCNNNGRVRAS